MPFPTVTDDLVQRYDVEAPRFTSYPAVPAWTEQVGPDRYAQALGEASDPLSLYVHLPFCQAMCSFCGCNMVVLRQRSQIDEYLEAVEAELDLVARRLGRRGRLAQIHWGGGTPTSLDEAQLERLWRGVEDRFDVEEGAELAVEIDPVVTRPSQLRLLRSFGFNRLSVGVQDLDEAVQAAIDRFQSAEETAAVLELARELGYRGLNVDMIYGLPQQSAAGWKRTLERVLAMRPDRASVYSFAYVPQVRHHQRLIRSETLPLGAAKLALFKIAYEAFENAGYVPIGMDHFARPGDALEIAQRERRLRRNFQGYTAAPVEEVVAVGASAISDLATVYAQNGRPLARYQAAVRGGRFATERGAVTSPDDRRRRRVIQSLMCHFWVDLGGDAPLFEAELDRLNALETEGLVRLAGTEIEATPLGRVFIRNVAAVFDAYARPAGYASRAV
ncbi:MAG TPA: oxygen-independent coproporphyrinogen III oxidase [Myxococcales bacterium]|nr:oxygen-independent coproporphyrinogen III oxidase [Myxococcales bacterium]